MDVADCDWDVSDILTSRVTGICSSLLADCTVITDKGVEHLNEDPRTAANVFKLALRGFITPRAAGVVGGCGQVLQSHSVV